MKNKTVFFQSLPKNHLLIIGFVSLSVIIGGFSFWFKGDIVELLPYQNEAAERPTGHLTFLNIATDSWGPMKLALTIERSPHGDRLFERLQEFQQTDNPELFPELEQFKDGRKFQYPLTSLLPIEILEKVGLDSFRSLNIINFLCFCINILLFMYLCLICMNQGKLGDIRRLTRKHLLITIFAGAAAFTFYPKVAAITNGNIQMWMNLLFTMAIIAWIKDKRLFSGICIALICGFKPQLAPLLVWAVFWKQWAFFKGMLATGIAIGLASLAMYGWHNNFAFIEVVREISKRGSMVFANESVNGVIHRLIEGPSERSMVFDPGKYSPYIKIVYLCSTAFALLMFAIAFLPAIFRGTKTPGVLGFVAICICFTLASPMIWNYHFGVLLPVYALVLKPIFDLSDSRRRTRMLILLGVSWILCASYMPITRLLFEAPWSLLSAPRFYGGLILTYIVYSVGIKVALPSWLVSGSQSKGGTSLAR